MHTESHPFAGQTVFGASVGDFRVEDWWDKLTGGSWMYADSNPAAMKYAMRAGVHDLPIDDEVVYGENSNGIGHLLHVSELVLIPTESDEQP